MSARAERLCEGFGELVQPSGTLRLDELVLRAGEVGLVQLEDPAALLGACAGRLGREVGVVVLGARSGTLEGRALIAVAPESFIPLAGLSVVEHLVLAIRLARRVGVPPTCSIEEALAVTGLEELGGAVVEDLGEPEQARVARAMALVRPARLRAVRLEDDAVGAEVSARVLVREAEHGAASLVVGTHPVAIPGAVRFEVRGRSLVRASRPRSG